MKSGAFVGGSICIVGSSLAVVGLNLQRWSLLKQARCAELGDKSGGAGFRCWWILSLVVYIGGQLVQMAALAFASQTLVSALSNVSLVTNVCVANLWFGEPFALCPPNRCDSCRWWRFFIGWDFGAMIILAAGSTTVIVFAPSTHAPERTYTTDDLLTLLCTPPYFFFLCGCIGLCLAAMGAIYFPNWCRCCTGSSKVAGAAAVAAAKVAAVTSLDNRRIEGLLYAIATASSGSITITLSKITMLLIKESLLHDTPLINPTNLGFGTGLLFCALLQIKVMNDGLARHEASLFVPAMYVLNTVLTICGGELMYQTYLLLSPKQLDAYLFTGGVLVSLIGVYLLSTHSDEAAQAALLSDEQVGAGLETIENTLLLTPTKNTRGTADDDDDDDEVVAGAMVNSGEMISPPPIFVDPAAGAVTTTPLRKAHRRSPPPAAGLSVIVQGQHGYDDSVGGMGDEDAAQLFRLSPAGPLASHGVPASATSSADAAAGAAGVGVGGASSSPRPTRRSVSAPRLHLQSSTTASLSASPRMVSFDEQQPQPPWTDGQGRRRRTRQRSQSVASGLARHQQSASEISPTALLGERWRNLEGGGTGRMRFTPGVPPDFSLWSGRKTGTRLTAISPPC